MRLQILFYIGFITETNSNLKTEIHEDAIACGWRVGPLMKPTLHLYTYLNINVAAAAVSFTILPA